MNEILNQLNFIYNNLHFIRADWFYTFIPLFIYLLLSYKKTLHSKNWQSIIDPQLLPFVLNRTENKQYHYPTFLIFIAGSLCITALAGPVYKKLPQPVYREQSSLVVLLDLSQSMNATDIKPSRLSRAKLELLDILKTRKTGQTALIVFAADAFTVTPLTDDNATIANLVPSLETDMMPAQGSNLSIALAKTFSLLTQAGIINGDILLITDDIHQRDEDAIKKIYSQGHRLSIFGIGTAEGSPIPLDGGFLQDSNGAIVIPKLHSSKLQRYALSGGGLYTDIQADDSDVNKLTNLFQSSKITLDSNNKNTNADVWQEEGHWLLLPLLFFAALWARKGWIAAALPFALLITVSIPRPVYAETAYTKHDYLNVEHLWSSPDQKAMKAFNQGDNENAAKQFNQSEWKASAYYRNGDYQAAVETLENTNSSDGFYNKGNALSKLEKYKEAIDAYDKAIELDKNNEDAIYNREQVKQALDKQQDDSQQNNDEQDNSENDESNQDSSEQENSDQQNTEQDNPEQNNSKNQQQQSSEESSEENNKTDQNEQQQAEDEQLKQRDAEAEKKQQQQEKEQYEQEQQDQQDQDQAKKSSDSIENTDPEDKNDKEKPEEIEVNPIEASITEEEKATEQWLNRIPDDPGGLLRRKFYYQYKQVPNQNDTNEPW
jgi:Ca-activated chloride channel family protein